MKLQPYWILAIVLVVIIIIQQAVIQFRKPEPVYDNSKELMLLDSISNLQQQIETSKALQAQLQRDYDDLANKEAEVIIRTNDKIKYIYIDANIDELDSIIRTNWKYPE